MDTHETDHIWLRQAITFTVDGQTRTLEIGIPVPRNATAEDVEALLEAADAGMSALSRRLDGRVAEVLAGGALPQMPAIAHTPAGNSLPALPTTTTQEQGPVSVNGRAPAETPRSSTGSDKPIEQDTSQPRGASAPRTDTTPTSAPAASQPRTPPPPTPPERPAATQRPAPQPPRAQTPAAAPVRPTTAANDAPASGRGEMTRPEFLAAAAELGLNPRQAMDHLGVRSLEGLNLREALESLRRQSLGATPQPEPEAEPDPEPISSATAPAAPARYFDEEDDESIYFDMTDDDDSIEDDDAPVVGGGAPQLASDDTDNVLGETDLEDVPDLSPPPATRSRQRATSTARKAPNMVRESPSPAPERASNDARTQAMQLIGKLRSATGGGPASDYQRNAYHNIVEDELGKTQATALVRGLWHTTADHLSADQLDALIRWGKEEVFAEEAAQVLVALRAEQRRAEQPEASASAAVRPPSRAAARGRTQEGSR